MKVYLGGAITGNTYEEMHEWRADVVKALPLSAKFLNPVNGGEQFKDNKCLSVGKGNNQADAVFYKDVAMLDKCDILFMNLLTVKPEGLGCPWEMGYCYAKGKYQVIIAPDRWINHPFAIGSGVVFKTVDEGISHLMDLHYSGAF